MKMSLKDFSNSNLIGKSNFTHPRKVKKRRTIVEREQPEGPGVPSASGSVDKEVITQGYKRVEL